MLNKIFNEDCLEGMKRIPDGSIDAIITDPPYWTTACKWDSIIPFEPMWAELKRIIKPNWAIVLFGSEPFSSALRMSNIKNYKYDWIWEKDKWTNIFNAYRMPLKVHENISVFYEKQSLYNPQKTEWNGDCRRWSHNIRKEWVFWKSENIWYSDKYEPNKRLPKSIQKFSNKNQKQNRLHPTQKPVALIEYLIKTYSLENEIILDFTSGSWTTWIAAQNTNRQFILIEKDKNYYDISLKRLQENQERLDKLSKKDII